MADSQIDRALLQQCCADGADGVRQMAGEVIALAKQFRGADVNAANAALARLARDLRSLVVLAHGLRDAAATLDHHITLLSDDEIRTLVGWLQAIVRAQETQNWPAVANLLESELARELRMWLARLEAASLRADVRAAVSTAASQRTRQI